MRTLLARRVVHNERRLLVDLQIFGQIRRQQVAEATHASPATTGRALMTELTNQFIRQRLKRHRQVGGSYDACNFGGQIPAKGREVCDRMRLAVSKRWRLSRSLSLALTLGLRQLRGRRIRRDRAVATPAIEQQPEQVGLTHLAVADRGIGRSGLVVGEDHCAAGMGTKPMQQRREVGIARQDDELIEIGVVRDHVPHVHDDADISGILELGGQRRAVDHFGTGAQEMVPDERERIHIGRAVVAVPARHRIAVAAVQHDPARTRRRETRRRCDQGAGLDFTQPQGGVLGKPLSGVLALALQRQVDVVVIDKNRA